MAKVIQTSFSAGEVSPSLWGRVDLAKYKVGAATMRNFFVDYRGGASNRPGTKFVGRANNDSTAVRLIPFQFSTIQTYVLEFSNLAIRFISSGAYVLEANKNITGVTNANPGVVTSNAHGYANGDWVYISGVGGTTGINGGTYKVAGVTANTFQLNTLDGATVNTSAMGVYTAGGTVARYYTLVTPYVAADLALLKFTQSADVMTITHPSYAPRDLARLGATNWTLTALTFASSIAAPTGLSVAGTAGTTYISYQVTAVDQNGQESIPCTAVKLASVNITTTAGSCTLTWAAVAGALHYNIYRAPIAAATDVPQGANYGFIGVAYGTQFVDGNIVADFTKTPPQHYNPFALSPITAINITAGGAGYVAATTSANITDASGTGASIVPIVVGGAVVAFIILDGGSGYTAPTVNVVGAGAGFIGTATVGPSSGTYPSTVAYFQQRKWFAAPTLYPETLYASKPASFKNMDFANPSLDTDSLQLTLASQQVNSIKYMVPMPGGLVTLTAGGAWQISGGTKGDAVTSSSATATSQSYNGCADLPPLVINYDILYVQAKGSIVRDLSYNFFVNIYTGTDVTVLSNHLFNPHTLVEWCWAEEPYKIVWAVRNDGVLLSLTYLKEQEVQGWARHDTQGQFKSICTIQEGQEDAVYFVVKRYIGSRYVQYVERLAGRIFPNSDDASGEGQYTVENSWFVDCGLDYTLTYPAATVTASRSTVGTGATFTASTGVFAVGDIGKVLRMGGGQATITGYTSATLITGTITAPILDVIQDNTNLTPYPQTSGNWSLTMPTTSVSGLAHLEGQTVKILGDGNTFPDKVVTNGAITLDQPCSRIIVGLGYTAQLQTLDLEVSEGGGTIQGKRKKLSQTTIKVQNTRGIKYGPDFSDLAEVKQRGPGVSMGTPIPLLTGQFEVIPTPMWTVEGRVCIQQDYPLPATVLAIAPDVSVGD